MVIGQGGGQARAGGSWSPALLGQGLVALRGAAMVLWDVGKPWGAGQDSQGWWCPQGNDSKSLPYYWLFKWKST